MIQLYVYIKSISLCVPHNFVCTISLIDTCKDFYGEISFNFNNEYLLKSTDNRVTTIVPNYDQIRKILPNLSAKINRHIWSKLDGSWLIIQNSLWNPLIFHNQTHHNSIYHPHIFFFFFKSMGQTLKCYLWKCTS